MEFRCSTDMSLHACTTCVQQPKQKGRRTMLQDSGWCDRKSRMRQPSWMLVLGLGRSACTISGNWMPSRMKKTWTGQQLVCQVCHQGPYPHAWFITC